MSNRNKSRRKTPCDSVDELTQTQEFIKVKYTMVYDQHHPHEADEYEINMINSFVPKKCPYCSAQSFTKKGHIWYTEIPLLVRQNIQADHQNNILIPLDTNQRMD